MPSQPPAPPGPPRRPATAAESALRALFRRHPPAPAPPVERPPPGRHLELPSLLALARSSDYFALLGLPRDASGSQVRDAAARLVSELDVLRLSPQLEYDPVELQEARQVVIDARDVLADDALRAAYLNGIEDVAESTAP